MDLEEELAISDEESEKKNEWERLFDPIMSPQKFILTGLQNMGNTCYMSAVIQNLNNIPNFLKELTKLGPSKGNVSEELLYLIGKMQTEKYKTLSPRLFRKAVAKTTPQFDCEEQQDAHEFAAWVLKDIMEDVNEAVQDDSTESNYLCAMFNGIRQYKLQCKLCDGVSIKEEPFNWVMLDIPTKQGKVTLQECFKASEKAEEVECDCHRYEECADEDCKCCSPKRCKSTKAKQTSSIKTYPEVLMVQIKRLF